MISRRAAVLRTSRSIFDVLRLTLLRTAALQEFQISTLPGLSRQKL